MTDTAARIAGLSDEDLTSLHDRLDRQGLGDDAAVIEAHHLVTTEMMKRNMPHDHVDDQWARAVVVKDTVTVGDPEEIQAPEGFQKAWGETLKNGGTVHVLLTVDGYVLKADPTVSDVHVDTIMSSPKRRNFRPPITEIAKTIVEEDGKWVVYNEDRSRKFGSYATEAEAKARLSQIESFKKADWKIGDFASWNSSGGMARGRIEHIMRSGVLGIPDSDFSIRADKNDPAVLLRIYRRGPEGWMATETLVGHKASSLRPIEDLVKKESSYEVPEDVQRAAKVALEWIADGRAGDGFTSVGRNRAKQLAAGGSVSHAVLVKMRAYFARHIVDKDAEDWGDRSDPTPGMVAWYAWGGDPGRAWANRVLGRVEKRAVPEPIRDIHLNLENRQHAIDEYLYGPMNPEEPGDYWERLGEVWGVPAEEAATTRCRNCAAFNVKPEILDAIAENISEEGDDVVEAADLGYCELFQFKCAGARSCAAWLTGGPIGREEEDDEDEIELLASMDEEDLAEFASYAYLSDEIDDMEKRGNPEALRDYWRGGGKGKVSWGAGGDFTACVAAVGKYMTSEQAKGYCAIRHREVTGMWPGDKRNRAKKSLEAVAKFTLPGGATYEFSVPVEAVGPLEPMLKHPGHPDQKVHGGRGGAASSDLSETGRKMIGSNLSRGNLVESYGASYEHGKTAQQFGPDHVKRVVQDHAEKRDALIDRYSDKPRSMATENAAFAVAQHQGFIDGALGARPAFARTHSFGETVAGLFSAGLSGATKSIDEPFEKHPGHADQKVHAGRSTSVEPDVAESIVERVRANGGLSVNMMDGSEPPDGFMVARGTTGGVKPRILEADEFYDPERGPAALSSFLKDNRSTLTTGDYLGVWHDQESGKVFLDVSQNVKDQGRAESLGRRRDQISIWDVTNMKEIPTGGTGEISKSEASSGTATAGSVDDDGRGDRSVRSGDLDEVHGEVVKHGRHDQADHGRRGAGYRGTKERRRGEIAAGQTKRPLPRDAEGRVINPDATGGYKAGIPETVIFGGETLTPSDSLWHHLESDGKGGLRITEERAALHKKIVEDATRGVPQSEDPTFYMLGGGPAAGKTTAVKSGLANVPDKDTAVQINADDVKSSTPEFERMRMSESDDDFFNAAAFAHEESSLVAKQIQKAAVANGQDIVLDGTGDSKYASLSKKVGQAREAGYKVKAVYATVPTQTAVNRANDRSLKSTERRFVPESVVRGTHRDVSAVFPEAVRKGLFDEARLIDTTSDDAVLIGETVNGQWTVRDQGRYAEFLDKGRET